MSDAAIGSTRYMGIRRGAVLITTVLRCYAQAIGRALHRGLPDGLWRVRLGPQRVPAGHEVLLRTPRLHTDGAEWSQLRLANRDRIEPWWVTSEYTWQQRHSEAAWVSFWMHARRAARAGRELHLVVEVDGVLAGQCSLEWIDPVSRSAELGIWLDGRVSGRGVGAATTALLVNYGFEVLGLRRITAPVHTGNEVAARTMRRAGLHREATMSAFLSVGGRPQDHDLWAVTAERWPQCGLLSQLHPGQRSA